MKKFVVETNDNLDKDDVSTCLHNMDHYAFGTFKVTELPSIPEVKMVETGVLMSPAEIVGCDYVDTITWVHKGESMQLCKDSSDIGKRLNIYTSFYPHVFYRDIQKTWDFASIPVGALIEVMFNNGDKHYGVIYMADDKTLILKDARSFKVSNIKSIRIIEVKNETNTIDA